MDFLDKFRKKRANTTDILMKQKDDRRLLSHVPDETHKRSNTDRRAHDPEKKITKYEDYIFEQESGIRYITGFDVSIKSYSSGDIRIRCLGTVADISDTGMLIELNHDDYEALKTVEKLKVKFRVEPGSMPEGNEMRVRQKVTIVRRFTTTDGKCMCAVVFSKRLHRYAAVNKDRYMLSAASLLLAFSVGCIVLMRAESIIYFKFNKLLYLYSLITAVFLLSRYIFGAFYRPKKVDPDFTPGVTVLIPCFNEEEWIHRTITSCLNQEYPIDKLEVIVIDDHSSDKSVERIKDIVEKLKSEAPEIYHVDERLSYYVQPKNMGKREALIVGAEKAKHELVVFVDSDSFLDPFAIRNIVQPFKDPKMGGVSGRTDVANTYTNALTKMQAVRYYVAFRVMKAAEGLFDTVTCLSGPLSCYRKSIILENKDAWLNQKFLGQKATFGDDRSMTNFILRHYRTTYQDTAVCQTIVPNKHKVFLKQQMRWKRSWLRESLIAATFMWKKEPFAAVTFYMGIVVPIAAPIVVLYNLVYVPLTQHIFPTSFILGIFLMSLLMSMAQLFLRKSSTWMYGMLFCLYYELVLLWQMPIAWFTFWKSTWGTRMTPEDVKAAERKLRRRLIGNKKYITPAEFAKVLGLKEENVISEMDNGKFAKYVHEVNGHKMIMASALKDFYDNVSVNIKTDEELVSDYDNALKEGAYLTADTAESKEENNIRSTEVQDTSTSAENNETVPEAIVSDTESSAETINTSETIETKIANTTDTIKATETVVIPENSGIKETKTNAEVISFAAEKKDKESSDKPAVSANITYDPNDTIYEYRLKALEERLEELVLQHKEERSYLMDQIKARDDIIRIRDSQIDSLIKGIEIANSNTSRILDLALDSKNESKDKSRCIV